MQVFYKIIDIISFFAAFFAATITFFMATFLRNPKHKWDKEQVIEMILLFFIIYCIMHIIR